MTELSFLIDLLLNHKLHASTKKLVADRIKSVSELSASPYKSFSSPTIIKDQFAQSASTQALMAKHEGIAQPMVSSSTIEAPLPPPSSAASRIVGGEVNTGKGSRGPRKF